MLIATDGLLPVEHTVERVQRLHEDGDAVVVMTAVNLPRRLLDRLKVVAASDGADIDEIVEAAGPGLLGMAGADRVAERLASSTVQAPVIEDFVERYLTEMAESTTQPMIDGLAAADIEADALARETENETAATIITACRDKRIDLLVIGSTGRGRFEGLLGSTGTKLVRHAPCDVLLIRVSPDG